MSDIDDHTYSANNDQKIYYEEVGGESILHEQHDQDMSGGYDHQQQQHHHLMQQQQEQLHMQQQQQQHHMQQQQHHMQQLQGSSFENQFSLFILMSCLLQIKLRQIGVPIQNSSSRRITNLFNLSWIVDESQKWWFEVKVFDLQANIK